MKLILFDIDGTLAIGASRSGKGASWEQRTKKTLKKVYDVDLPQKLDFHEYDGLLEKQCFWLLVKRYGISQKVFEEKFSLAHKVHFQHLQESFIQGNVYTVLPGALDLLNKLKSSQVNLAVITGNVELSAWYKLEQAGLRDFFTLGLFGSDGYDRNSLAQTIFTKAYNVLGTKVQPSEVIVVGDTINDIYAGKYIKAKTISVTTTKSAAELAAAHPDLIVDSLSDPKVYKFLGIEK